ncbi:MAG: hypothetical protein IJ060_01040 [Oscillospiraceae bacterium]|nr:hypothetical protein [Oscillospiraceae bacterium]
MCSFEAFCAVCAEKDGNFAAPAQDRPGTDAGDAEHAACEKSRTDTESAVVAFARAAH